MAPVYGRSHPRPFDTVPHRRREERTQRSVGTTFGAFINQRRKGMSQVCYLFLPLTAHLYFQGSPSASQSQRPFPSLHDTSRPHSIPCGIASRDHEKKRRDFFTSAVPSFISLTLILRRKRRQTLSSSLGVALLACAPRDIYGVSRLVCVFAGCEY